MNLLKTKGINDKPRVRRAERVLGFSVPGLGRIAVTRDTGEANLFAKSMINTNLSGRLLDPKGRLIEAFDWGSGLVTNVGVLALAEDAKMAKEAKAKAPFNLFSFLEWHSWGTSSTAVTEFDIKLNATAAPNATKNTKVETVEVVTSGIGKPKYKVIGKIKAESSISIAEWGLFTKEELSETKGTGKFISVTATTGKGSGVVFTASTDEILGERQKVAVATEATEIWGLVTKSETEVLTVPAWYKQSNGVETSPSPGTSPFTMKPVMWDHKTFTGVGVETGNEIQFIYELEFPSGH